jgi:hypothetical protein
MDDSVNMPDPAREITHEPHTNVKKKFINEVGKNIEHDLTKSPDDKLKNHHLKKRAHEYLKVEKSPLRKNNHAIYIAKSPVKVSASKKVNEQNVLVFGKASIKFLKSEMIDDYAFNSKATHSGKKIIPVSNRFRKLNAKSRISYSESSNKHIQYLEALQDYHLKPHNLVSRQEIDDLRDSYVYGQANTNRCVKDTHNKNGKKEKLFANKYIKEENLSKEFSVINFESSTKEVRPFHHKTAFVNEINKLSKLYSRNAQSVSYKTRNYDSFKLPEVCEFDLLSDEYKLKDTILKTQFFVDKRNESRRRKLGLVQDTKFRPSPNRGLLRKVLENKF